MIDDSKRLDKQREKEKVRKRMRVTIDPENYEYFPERKKTDYYDNDIPQRVGIYVRVSTDNVKQTTSYELQKKYYEDFVRKHPNWELVKIYADEGISGTSLKHRDAFNEMIADSKAGKLDLIITKSVSRFARNIIITIGMARDLAKLKPPVGIFFESECIFSLNDDSQMALSFQATMAEEESHTRSRSMESSLRMRLDNGIPLTPKLYGYSQDADGNLVINPEEAPIVKLMFYMYLFGFSTKQIADVLNALGHKTYYGKQNWSTSVITQILRNERHCGDVLTRKTFTEDFRTHRTLKNRGDRPQSKYYNHHEAIVSRDDYIAVQRMLDNAKFHNKASLPELRVIDSGMLKGFVTVNPRWAGFKEKEYLAASASVYTDDDFDENNSTNEVKIEVTAGDLDLRDFQIARSELFGTYNTPTIQLTSVGFKLNTELIRRLNDRTCVELLINPIEKKLAIRTTTETNRCSVIVVKKESGRRTPKKVSCMAFGDTLFSLLGWDTDVQYKVVGTTYEDSKELVCIFDTAESVAYINSSRIPFRGDVGNNQKPVAVKRELVKAIPKAWTASFGKPFYIHEQPIPEITNQNEDEWKLRIEGQLFETGKKLNVTSFEELRNYISQETRSINLEELSE